MDNFQSELLKELSNNFNDFKAEIKTDIALIKKDTAKIPGMEKQVYATNGKVLKFELWKDRIEKLLQDLQNKEKTSINIDARKVKPIDWEKLRKYATNIGIGLAGFITVIASFGEKAQDFIK